MQNGIKFDTKDDVNRIEERKENKHDENDDEDLLTSQQNTIQEEASKNLNEHQRPELTSQEEST